jgi:hypothetical protein
LSNTLIITMKKTLLILLVISIAFMAGCKIDEADLSAGGSFRNTYQPRVKGTYWKYTKTSVGSTAEITETQTMTGDTTVFNKKKYYIIRTQSSVTDNVTGYFCHDGDSYFIRNASAALGIDIEYLYLKDNYIVGRTWSAPVSDDGMVNGVPAQIVGAVIEKGGTKYVSSKKFTDVIHTRLFFQYDQGTGFETISVIDYYIAKGIGIIQIDYSDGTTLQSSNAISDYDIK